MFTYRVGSGVFMNDKDNNNEDLMEILEQKCVKKYKSFLSNPVERLSLLKQAQPAKKVILPGSVKAAQHLL